MNFEEMISRYSQDADNVKMNRLTRCLSTHLEAFRSAHEDRYDSLMRRIFGILNDGHYDETYAAKEISGIEYTDRHGEKAHGSHWTLAQAEAMMKDVDLPQGTCKYDWWVALSATYSDLCTVLDDRQIADVACMYWFRDEDWNTDTKIWDYMTLRLEGE